MNEHCSFLLEVLSPSNGYPNPVRHVRVIFTAFTSAAVDACLHICSGQELFPEPGAHTGAHHTHKHTHILLRSSPPVSRHTKVSPLNMLALGGLTLWAILIIPREEWCQGTHTNVFFSIRKLELPDVGHLEALFLWTQVQQSLHTRGMKQPHSVSTQNC